MELRGAGELAAHYPVSPPPLDSSFGLSMCLFAEIPHPLVPTRTPRDTVEMYPITSALLKVPVGVPCRLLF